MASAISGRSDAVIKECICWNKTNSVTHLMWLAMLLLHIHQYT